MFNVCIDKELPADKIVEAAERAVAENPANAPEANLFRLAGFQAAGVFHPARWALITGKKWLPGRIIRAGFLGGTPAVQAKVVKYARIWEQYVNLKFEFGDGGKDIRIAFDSLDGSWSYIGTDCLSVDDGEPTMNFGWVTASSSAASDEAVICHEFGHGLACIHEHQNPVNGIQWNKPVVYEDYQRTQGWSRQEVDRNVIQKYATDITQFSVFDPASIMEYPILARHTLDGFSTPGGKVLSVVDKAYAAAAYPRATTLPPTGDWVAKVRQARDLLTAALPSTLGSDGSI